MQQRIRAAMAADQAALLQGIVKADETYVGGRPRYPTNKRGRGTDKVPVLGVVERSEGREGRSGRLRGGDGTLGEYARIGGTSASP